MRTTSLLTAFTALVMIVGKAHAQSLPSEMYLDPATHKLHTGGLPSTGLYAKQTIRTLDLQFAQSNYWNLMTQNYSSKTNIPATLTVDGVVYDSVGVRFKGNTSYTMLPSGSQKKSFNITMDDAIADQDLMGYGTLNLNNAHEDASFLREVIYLDLIRDHVPAAKANFVHLNINGASWGIYPNVQQLNSRYLKEWYFSNNGSLWRADRPDGVGPGPGGGAGWGDGTAALNYLGADTTTYKTYYTLKRTEQEHPWNDLVRTCQKLNQLPSAQLEDSLDKYMDLDRTLWFLASEIAFSDDDSYVYKGKMDYYLYWDEETGRMTPLEFDGNSAMKTNATNWSPFYNVNNANYPLMNRLFAVPRLRQRYLAHLRTIINEKMQSSTFNALVDGYATLIDAEVQADPKKLYTYNAFLTELNTLKTYMTNRRNYLTANTEVAQVAPVISAVSHRVNGTEWADPTPSQEVAVTATIGSGAARADLYYSHGIYGRFTPVQLFDDGAHGDGASGDGVFGGSIPAAPAMTRVRYYVMATAGNTAQSVSFFPPGAEHDVFTYVVQVEFAVDPVVRINELLAQNTSGQQDENGQYEDWIELFNTGSEPFDLSGGWLSDDGGNVFKWQFPENTVIAPQEYLIIWADEDQDEGPLHTSFKLSASGEDLWLTTSTGLVLDQVTFGAQTANMAYARIPNGTGPFVHQAPTFAANNEITTGLAEAERNGLLAYPNPASSSVTIRTLEPTDVVVRDALQRTIWSGRITSTQEIDASTWANGTYFIHTAKRTIKLVVAH